MENWSQLWNWYALRASWTITLSTLNESMFLSAVASICLASAFVVYLYIQLYFLIERSTEVWCEVCSTPNTSLWFVEFVINFLSLFKSMSTTEQIYEQLKLEVSGCTLAIKGFGDLLGTIN